MYPTTRLAVPIDAAERRSAALPEMAPAIIILNEAREVEFVNHSAGDLFTPIDPVRCTMPALLISSASTGGEDIFFALDAREDPVKVRIALADGRLLDCMPRTLSSGGYVLSLEDVTSVVRDAEMAKRDGLTGLANRAAFRDRLVERLAAAERGGQAVAVFYIDLDRFKAVNDTLGHPVGDALLIKVSDRIKSTLRVNDFAARLGGDEFAIIQSEAPQPAAATSLAARLVDLVSRTYLLNGQVLHVGTSIGIALFPSDGREPDTLLKNADLALYRAKAEGGGVYHLYESGMDERMQARRAMEIDLRRSLALKELQLEYQPQFDLATDALIGFEALIRWRHPIRGNVSPADFIPLAEDIGIISAIGEWVLRTACHQAASWQNQQAVAVNVAPSQFRRTNFVEIVESALELSGLPPTLLELELTEGALMQSTELVLNNMNRLRAIGVKLTLDDFGTGYSSLSYLRAFPFNKLKIDRAFIHDVHRDPAQGLILHAITSLATALGMTTIAEGVETTEELNAVRAQGCGGIQGFLTGRPMSADAAADLVNSSYYFSPEADNERRDLPSCLLQSQPA